MRATRDERDVVDAMPGRVEGPKLEPAARDRLAVGNALVGGHVGQRVREQRRADALCHVGDVDDVVAVAVRAEDVRDRDLLARGTFFECGGQPVRVDEHAVPARLIGDQVRVRQPTWMLDSVDDHAGVSSR